MDEIDIFLILSLLGNSRTPYQVLAERLHLSVNAVHKRLQALNDEGVIQGFTAKPSLYALGAYDVLIYGQSKASPVSEAMKRLASNDSVFWVTVASGNYLYVGCYIRNISELEAIANFVREMGEISEPKVGITTWGMTLPTPAEPFDDLDWRIIYQLKDDSRKPLTEIAEAVNSSAKTVRRHLDDMVGNFYIDLGLAWYPDKGNDIMTIFHAKTRAGGKFDPQGLTGRYLPNLLYAMSFSNLPGEHLLVTWTKSMKELKDLGAKFEAEGVFESVSPNILYTGKIYPTWRDKMTVERGRPPT
jgi:Lrp/AsnC family leucine-responsive transcriptional regulator